MICRRAAALLAAALIAGLEPAIWHPAVAGAGAIAPGTISTYAGSTGSGLGTKLPQYPVGIAIHNSTLYISSNLGDFGTTGVVRALDLNTDMETLYAGNGDPASNGDGGPAVDAAIHSPQQLAVDPAGDLFIATVDRIREVTPGGTISTVAGGGSGALGDGGPATSATISAIGVAVAPSGDVIISDTGYNRVRRVHNGVITTIAGNGTAGFAGDGLPATAAELNGPEGVAVDASGNVFVADSQNYRVREISTSGLIFTVAGTGLNYPYCGGQGAGPGTATGFNLAYPSGLFLDGAGNLFITESGGCIDEVTSGMLTRIAGCNQACSSSQQGDGFTPLNTAFYGPTGAVTDGSGNLYVALAGGQRVQEAPAGGGTMFTIAGTGGWCTYNTSGQAVDAYLCDPKALAMDTSGDLFIAETQGHVVEEITAAGAISTVAGNGTYGSTGDGGSATAAELQGPGGVAIDASGNLYIAAGADLRKVSGGVITTVAGGIYPDGLAIDPSGNILAASSYNQRVYRVTAGGSVSTLAGTGTPGFSGDGGPATSAQLSYAFGVGADSAGNVFILDLGNQRIRKVDAGGTISTFAKLPSPLNGFSADGQLAVGPGDQVVVGTAYNWQNVLMFTPAGNVVVAGTGVAGFSGDGGPATGARLQQPDGVAFDASGDLFVADNGNHRIRRVQTYGATAAPTGVTALAGYASIHVAWKAPVNSTGLPIVDYEITPYVGATPGTPVHVSGMPAPTSVVIPGLAAGTQYTFKVSASNGWQRGPDSAPSAPVTALPHSGSGTIVTWAGTLGVGPPLSVGQAPYSVAMNGTDVYVGDVANAVIRKIDTLTGQESVLAGTGSLGYSGDGGPATSARISGASAIAVCDGTTYFADASNYVIRKIDPQGIITTVAGTGIPGYSGDGGPATSAQISLVLGLACRTGGGLYVSDSGNGAERIIDGAGTISTWWYGFSLPTGVAEMGATDTLAVSDSGLDNVVWGLTDTTATVLGGTLGQAGFADGAPGTSLLSDPRGLTYNGGEGIFVADRGNNRVRQIIAGNVYTQAGTGVAGFSGDTGQSYNAELNSPTDAQMAGSLLLIADLGNNRVREVQLANCCTITSIAGDGWPASSGDGGSSIDAQVGAPYAVAVDAAGNQYVADNLDNVIRKIDTNGVITTVVGTGTAGYAGDGAAAANAELDDPRGVFVAPNGDIYITDTGNQVVRRVDHTTGNISTVAGNHALGAGYGGDGGAATGAQLNYPRAVAVDSSGDFFIADTGNNRVREVHLGNISTVAGTGVAGFSDGLATASQLNGPRGLAFDSLGHLFIGDSNNNRVRELDLSTGMISTYAGTGQAGAAGDGGTATAAELDFPFGLAFDGAGNLFIADTANNRIRVVDTHGVITSVVAICGTSSGLSGDWGPASLAQVNVPYGLGVDGQGDIFIADSGNNRVRIVYGLVGLRTATCTGPGGVPGSRPATSAPGGVPSTFRIERGAITAHTPAAIAGLGAITPKPVGRPIHSVQRAPAAHTAQTAPTRRTAAPAIHGSAASASLAAAPHRSTALASGHAPGVPGAPAVPLGLAALAGMAVLAALVAGVRRRRQRPDRSGSGLKQ